jgi:hypothetical protein
VPPLVFANAQLALLDASRPAVASLIAAMLGHEREQGGPVMKSGLWLLLGIAIGGVAGWYMHALGGREVRATAPFAFSDRLANDPRVAEPYLFAKGTWRGSDLANKINTVEIMCEALKMTCEMTQADVMSLGGPPGLSLYTKSFRITKLDAQSVLAEPASPDPLHPPDADLRPRGEGSDVRAHQDQP